jgi:hypothetical protein
VRRPGTAFSFGEKKSAQILHIAIALLEVIQFHAENSSEQNVRIDRVDAHWSFCGGFPPTNVPFLASFKLAFS